MSGNQLDWALHWAGRGLYVFPVHPNSKRPIHKDWPDIATTDPAQVSAWWQEWPDANIGAHPGASGHVVIDVDNKKVDGDASYEELQETFGRVPETLTTTTPTGGYHIWMRLLGSCRNSANSLFPGIDTRGVRGFVVMPGSLIDGVEYTTNDAAITRCPEGWEDPLHSLGARSEEREAQEGVELDDPGNIERAAAHLARLMIEDDVAVAGSGGNDRTFRVATMLRDYGLTEEKALHVVQDWNGACHPPWSQSELATIFLNAYNYAQNEAGAKALVDPSGAGFAAVPNSPAERLTSTSGGDVGQGDRFKPLSIGEMADLPEPSWLIPGWLPHYELTMLYGPYGSYKSFIALDLALSIAAGVAPLGTEDAPDRSPVIYIAGEGQIGVGKQRIPAWLTYHDVDGASLDFHMIREMPHADAGTSELSQLFKAIEETCGDALPRLVVFDTHARAMLGLDENTVQDTAKAVNFYEQVLKRYSCAGLLIHHTGVDGSRERGSTSLGASCFAVHHADYDLAGKQITLSCKKMKDAEPPKPLYLQPTQAEPSIVLTQKTYEAPTEKPSHSTMYYDVVKVLRDNEAHTLGSAMTTAALAASMPDVLEDTEQQESARQKMIGTLGKASKKELKALVMADISPPAWCLPLPQ